MNIDLGNYIITSDEFQFILHERKIYGEKSKHAGKEFLAVVGYYPSWRGLSEKLLHLNLDENDANTFTQLVIGLQQYTAELTQLFEKWEKTIESTTSS